MRSYTLIELVIVLVTVGIVAAVGVPAMLQTGEAWSFASGFQDFAVQSSIVAMNRISREIRRLKDDASVVTANASQFRFTDFENNDINYYLNGTTLMRNSDGLTDNVTGLNFTYYDNNGNIISTPVVGPNDTDIRRIDVNLSLLAGTSTLNFRFQIKPQNIRRLNEKFK